MIWHKFSRSELLSTFFPTWLWQGRMWAKGKVPSYDIHYWGSAHSHPVLSTYYPIQIISSIIGSRLHINGSFIFYSWSLISHMVWCVLGWYLFLSQSLSLQIALFGAITFTFQAAHLRQQPCIIYTLSWFPWMLYGLTTHNILLSSVSIGMICLSGYYPLAVYLLPVSLIFCQWVPIGIGLLIGLPQIIPFLKHLSSTIRGTVSAPSNSPTEKKFYFGLTPIILLLLNFKLIYLALLIPCLCLFNKSTLFRVPQRALILSCYGAIYLSLLTMTKLTNNQVIALILVQSLDLWIHNKEVMPARPFVELWQKPSRAFNNKLTQYLDKHLGEGKVSGLPYPLFTGHINRFKTIGYCGSMQTKEMYAWRQSFKHDPFMDGVDVNDLTKNGIKYAYSRKKLDWIRTSVRNLYLNPAYSG